MKFTTLTALTLALATFDFSFAQDDFAASAVSSKMSINGLKQKKIEARNRSAAKGFFGPGKWKGAKKAGQCKNGKVEGTYACSNVDMKGFLSHEDMGSVSVSFHL